MTFPVLYSVSLKSELSSLSLPVLCLWNRSQHLKPVAHFWTWKTVIRTLLNIAPQLWATCCCASYKFFWSLTKLPVLANVKQTETITTTAHHSLLQVCNIRLLPKHFSLPSCFVSERRSKSLEVHAYHYLSLVRLWWWRLYFLQLCHWLCHWNLCLPLGCSLKDWQRQGPN